jgi:hypothetical protein
MKYFALATLLLATLAVVGCGSNSSSTPSNINGNWSATLTDTNNTTAFTLGTSLAVNGDGSLTVTNLTITSASPCFASGQTASGSFGLTGNFNGSVKGTFGMIVKSGTPSGNTLTLSGTANGNTISGTWTLAGGFGCTGNGTFMMTRM